MPEKTLLVDDDPNVLDGFRRALHREFPMDTASGGEHALALVEQGRYAVVVSDMRMPGMDGIELLSRVKSISPETVRIMLTGNGEIETAIDAVNEGNVFRFLTKPCSKELMAKTLTAALMQYRLVTAERELLEQTLSGSIQVLTEVLSLVNPAAFGRAMRARRYIHQVVTSMSLGNAWRYEVAAMMSQLGCVILHPETVDAVYADRPLSAEEQQRFDSHPLVARDLLSKIPRMEPIAWMIAHQREGELLNENVHDPEMAIAMSLGAQILRATLVFDELICKGVRKTQAVDELKSRFHDLDPRITESLIGMELEFDPTVVRSCRIDNLSPGMILQEEIRTDTGMLIGAKGLEVTFPFVLKLKNFLARGAVGDTVSVSLPTLAASAKGGA